MNDIRSTLAAAMHSQGDLANEAAKPVKSANDERLRLDAAQSGQNIHRSRRRNDQRTQPGRHTNTAIAVRADTGQVNREPVNREAPRNWTRSDKEAFEALPESTREFILRQCRSIETELGKEGEQLAAFHREYEPLAKILEPFAGKLKELNLTPQAAIQRYIDIERQLASGDGVAVIKALIDGYKVPADQLIEALDSQLSANQPAGGAERATALRDFEAQLEQFKTAQDTAGNPLHPHYADVEPEMAAIALAHRTRGRRIPPPKQLYEMAVWTKPALRSALVSDQQRAGKTTTNAEPELRTAARQPASSFDAGGSKRGLMKQPSGRSLRDEILAHVEGS